MRLKAVPRSWPMLALLLAAGVAAAVPLAVRLVAFGQHSLAVLAFPYQVDYDEGLNFHASYLLSQAVNIYGPPRPDRFVAAPYTPGFFVMNALLIRLAGATLLTGRLLALGSTLLIAVVIYLAVRDLTRRRLLAGLTAAFYLSLSPVFIWATFYKQDQPAIFLGLLGIYLLHRWQRPPLAYLSLVAFSAAFFTKQSGLVAPAAAVAWAVARDWRWGLRFALWTGLAVLGPVAAVDLLTRHNLYYHAVVLQRIPWLLDRLAKNLGKLLDAYALLAAVAAGYAVAGLRRGRASVFLFYFVAATGAMLSNGITGGNYNLLLEFFPAACVLAGVAAGRCLDALLSARPAVLRLMAAAPLLALIVQSWHLTDPATWYSFNRMPSPERQERIRSFAGMVAEASGDVLSEDNSILIAARKDIPYDDTFAMGHLGELGWWDESRLIQDLRDRRFDLVLLEAGASRWSSQQRAAFEDNYDLVFRDAFFLYRPRAHPLSPQYTLACQFEGGPRLEGYSLGRTGLAAGRDLQLTLYWSAPPRPARALAASVQLLDERGQKLAQRDEAVGQSEESRAAWARGEPVREERDLPVPAVLPAGEVRLIASLYDPATMQNLEPRCGPERRYGTSVSLHQFQVQGPWSTSH